MSRAHETVPALLDDPFFASIHYKISELETGEIKLLLEYSGFSTIGNRDDLIGRYAKFETYRQFPERNIFWSESDERADEPLEFDTSNRDTEATYLLLKQHVLSDFLDHDSHDRLQLPSPTIPSPIPPDPETTYEAPVENEEDDIEQNREIIEQQNSKIESSCTNAHETSDDELDRAMFHIDSPPDNVLVPENKPDFNDSQLEKDRVDSCVETTKGSTDEEVETNSSKVDGVTVNEEQVAIEIENRLKKLRQYEKPKVHPSQPKPSKTIPATSARPHRLTQPPLLKPRSSRTSRAILEILAWSLQFAAESGSEGKDFVVDAAAVFRSRGQRKMASDVQHRDACKEKKKSSRCDRESSASEREHSPKPFPPCTPSPIPKHDREAMTAETRQSIKIDLESWKTVKPRRRRKPRTPPPLPKIRPLMEYPISCPPPCYEVPALRHLLPKSQFPSETISSDRQSLHFTRKYPSSPHYPLSTSVNLASPPSAPSLAHNKLKYTFGNCANLARATPVSSHSDLNRPATLYIESKSQIPWYRLASTYVRAY